LSHTGSGESRGAGREGSKGGGKIELIILAIKTLELTAALDFLLVAPAPSCKRASTSV